MAYSGIINISNMTSNNAYACADIFVSSYKYLISAQAQAYGVQLIANQSGSNGMGFDYWDTSSYIGNNAWALFKFANAQVPFYLFIQYGTGTFGASPGNPASIGLNGDSNWTLGGVAFQIAMNSDGTNPWNGTTNANGKDSKGTPVWVKGSAPGLYVWPRWNSISGSYETNKERCFGFASSVYNNGTTKFRGHIMLNSENIIFAPADVGPTQCGNVYWFGRYDQFTSSVNPSSAFTASCPYAMVAVGYYNQAPTWNIGPTVVYGTTQDTQRWQGGIAHPDPKKGVVGCSIDTLQYMYENAFHPNTAFPGNQYDALPILLYMNEGWPTTNSLGLLGQTSNFVRWVHGMEWGDTSADKQYVVFSSTTTLSASKLLIPWDGTSTPDFQSTQGVRTGTIY